MTKLYISVDIEGVAGVVHWDQVMASGPAYSSGQRLLMEELHALCRGAFQAGVKSITINDAHSTMRNVIPEEFEGDVRLITGHFKPMYMMEGLDASFDAAVFLAYHGAAGTASVLSHTYSPRVIWEARLNGLVTGETGINALVAHHFRVPVVLITGDDETVRDAETWIPEAQAVAVKTSLGRFAADSMSPHAARTAIFEGIQAALLGPLDRVAESLSPIQLELTFQSAEMATFAEWVGATQLRDRTVLIEAGNGLDAYRMFHSILLLARTVVDA